MISKPIKMSLGVVLMIISSLFFIGVLVGNPLILGMLNASPLGFLFRFVAGAEDTSKLLVVCQQFESNLFMKDVFDEEYRDEFLSVFSKNDENFYLKSKFLCGALIEIVDEAEGGNLEGTVADINEDYGRYNINFDFDEISRLMEENDRKVWISELPLVLGDEINRGILDG